jgi:hypothetical protein
MSTSGEVPMKNVSSLQDATTWLKQFGAPPGLDDLETFFAELQTRVGASLR